MGQAEISHKLCKKCGEVRPRECFRKANTRKSGLASSCEDCDKVFREVNKTKIKAYLESYRAEHRDKAKMTAAIWRAADPERARESGRKSRILHKPHLSAKRKAWESENRELLRKLARETYWRNPEKYRQKHKKHYIENKEQYRAKDRQRRALELKAQGSHTTEEILELFNVQNGLCAISQCQKPLVNSGKGKYHIDHKHPLSRGGSDDIQNIALTCPYCNRSKGAKTMDEYLEMLAKSKCISA